MLKYNQIKPGMIFVTNIVFIVLAVKITNYDCYKLYMLFNNMRMFTYTGSPEENFHSRCLLN
jgi:hypothetical protein